VVAMLYIDSIWEYIVNFLELALFIIFIHKKLRIRANYKHQAVLMFLFVSFQFAVLCTLNKMGISSYSTLMSSCVLDIGYAVLFYRDSIIRRIFWGFSYSIICLVAEQISFFIPVTLYKGASLELLLGGTLRKPYTMLYLAMIAVFVLLFHSIGNKDISLSPFQKVAYIFIAISGLAIGHYILRLTLESVDKFGDSSFSARLSLVDLFFIILFLVLMLYIYQLGYSKEENIRLLEEQKIYELERTEFNSLSETTERLRKMKHDMQIYVDAINVLAKDKKWDELIAYTEQYHNTLATTQSAIATGNIAIDCILTAKLDYAEKHGIKTEYSIMAPENFPLDSVELSSILGNIWNNSIEAGERLIISDPTEHPYIYFYIKPYQNMILIHIENNYDGVIKGSIDGDILSVKQGKEHGLGIRLVKELVEKADGVLQITSDNKIFSVHIMIPDKENNKLL
jgi:Signal transduction histidine kinase regulating citrate/malate metabolism